MPSSDEFSSVIKEAGEMARKIGGELEEKIEGEVVDGEEIHGYTCKYNGSIYSVYGSPENEYLTINYDYSVTDSILREYRSHGGDISSEEANQKLKDMTENSIDDDRKADINYNLSKLLREGDIIRTYSIYNGVAHHFNLQSKIFPYRVNFDIADFNQSVTAVVETGMMGVDYLEREYGIRTIFDDEADDSGEEEGRGFL